MFDVDPCAGINSHVRAREYYFEQGLERPWRGRVWLNPPYSKIEPWIIRADQVVATKEAKYVVGLLPVRTSSGYWHGPT
jgi:hypothetical protein